VGPTQRLSGENLEGKASDARLAAWYQGGSLLDAIDSLSPPQRDLRRPARVPISEVLPKSRTLGAVAVSGAEEAGALEPGMESSLWSRRGAVATPKILERGGQREAAGRGTCTSGKAARHRAEWRREQDVALSPRAVLCHPGVPAPSVRCFEARVLIIDAPVPLLRGSQVPPPPSYPRVMALGRGASVSDRAQPTYLGIP